MKILHLVPTYLPAIRYGGPIQNVHNLNKELVRQGAAVTVLTTNVDGPIDLDVPLGRPVLIDGVEIFYFPTKWLRRWFYAPTLFRYLNQRIEGFDVVHITSVFLSFSFLGALAAQRHHRPYIISPRGSLMKQTFASKFWKKKIYFNLIERKGLSNATAIHLTSEAEKSDYLAAGFPAKKISVIGNGLDFGVFEKIENESIDSFRRKFNIRPNQKLVICLGRIDWTKGFDDLIPAFAEVVKEIPEAILLIIGDDERGYKKTVASLIRDNNLENNVVFIGPLQGREKIAALKSGAVFIQASYSESFGTAVAEAMAIGLPIVATKGVAIAPIIEKAGAGLIVEKKSQDLANALLEILQNKDSASMMGERGRAAAQENFSYSRIAADFLALYNEAINDFKKEGN